MSDTKRNVDDVALQLVLETWQAAEVLGMGRAEIARQMLVTYDEWRGRGELQAEVVPLNDCQGERTDADDRWQFVVSLLAGMPLIHSSKRVVAAEQIVAVIRDEVNAAVERAKLDLTLPINDWMENAMDVIAKQNDSIESLRDELDERCPKR